MQKTRSDFCARISGAKAEAVKGSYQCLVLAAFERRPGELLTLYGLFLPVGLPAKMCRYKALEPRLIDASTRPKTAP